jgi:diguanylate cyclase (GGDEF)-like protein
MLIRKLRLLRRQLLVGAGVVAACTIASIVVVYFVTIADPEPFRSKAIITATGLPLVLAPIAVFIIMRLEQRNHQLMLELERMANHDELTGLLNRRAFMSRSSELLGQPERLALLLADIDWFKRINDSHGHAVGDEALRHISLILQENAPEGGVLARLGGEEFVALFYWRQISEVRQVAESIRTSLESRPLICDGKEIVLTVSIGVAIREHADDVDKLLCRADQALYKAKSSGRNKTLLAA